MGKTTRALGALVLCGCAHGAIANEFQHQASLGNTTTVDDFDFDLWGVGYSYFFQSVDEASGPYLLAPLLSQGSRVSVSYNDVDGADFYGASGRWNLANDWFLVAEASYQDYAFGGSNTGYKLGAGYYLTDTTELSVIYGHSSSDSSVSYIDDSSSDSWRFAADHFQRLQSTPGIRWRGTYDYIDADDREAFKALNLTGDWFITRSLYLGGGYRWLDYGHDDDDFSVQAGYWLKLGELFSVNVDLIRSLDSDADDTFIALSGTARF